MRAGRFELFCISTQYLSLCKPQEFTGQKAVHAESGKAFNELAEKDIKKSLYDEVESE